MKHSIGSIIGTILFGIFSFLAMFWHFLPAINPLSLSFWVWLILGWVFTGLFWYLTAAGSSINFETLGISGAKGKNYDVLIAIVLILVLIFGSLPIYIICGILYLFLSINSFSQKRQGQVKVKKSGFRIKLSMIPLILVIITGIFGILSADFLHARAFSQRMVPENGVYDDLPTSDDVSHISLMDTTSAMMVGDREVGTLTDVVSQFEVSPIYTTLVYKNKIIKAAPLEYDGFFKYLNNFSEGIPGYVIVDTQSFSAGFVRTEQGIRYSPSAYFFDDLERHIRFQYPTLMFGDSRFEIDEEGTMYWVTSVRSHKFLFSGEYNIGAVITNAVTGESHYYKLDETPDWVDNVYTGEFVRELYDSYGMLRNGYINSMIGQKGCLTTTDDYGYLAKGNDLYIYTGVTSASNDASNLGFILVNARTGICRYVECAGAEEYSAMHAAQGVVQNYGYIASFPSLITIEGIPSYAMVLKDDLGLVKQYAIVNVSNYTLVSVADTFDEALADYYKKTGISQEPVVKETITETITISQIANAVIDGNTNLYLMTEDKIYRISLKDQESAISLKEGDEVTITYNTDAKDLEVIPLISVH